MEERTPKIAAEYLEHYKKVKYGMMPEWVWDMAIDTLKQKPKTGNWLMTGEVDVHYYLPSYECSRCGRSSLENGNYCPNCGAKMVDPQESEDKE